MKITVCEVPDRAMPDGEWAALLAALTATPTDILVLPELAGTRAFWVDPQFDRATWHEAIEQTGALAEAAKGFAARCVLGSRAIARDGKRLNETYIRTADGRLRSGRSKAWFPEMEGAWEATWFDAGSNDKTIAPVRQDGLSVATLLCTEVIVSGAARALGKAGTQLIAAPRATGGHPRWDIATRMAAVSAGAFVATANRRGETFAGGSWIIDPEGEVLARTSADTPIVTVDIDLSVADRAKQTYPRNVVD